MLHTFIFGIQSIFPINYSLFSSFDYSNVSSGHVSIDPHNFRIFIYLYIFCLFHCTKLTLTDFL